MFWGYRTFKCYGQVYRFKLPKMIKNKLIIIFSLFAFYNSQATNFHPTEKTISDYFINRDSGNVKVSCSEKKKKNENGKYPILVTTCLLKNFKIIDIGNPDYSGRYSHEYEVYKKVNKKFIKANNSEIFNKSQEKLLSLINQNIQSDFKKFSTDPDTKDCFISHDTIPKYEMNELGISFYGDEIWFSVDFGLSGYCMNVGGTVVSFKLTKIKNYLN